MSDKAQSVPKRSSVRHTRAIQRDRSKRPTVAPPDEQVEARLTELIHPAMYAQVEAYRAMGLRHRILTLPVLAYFWVGSLNSIQTQVWATWLLYAVLIDLTDNVRDGLSRLVSFHPSPSPRPGH